MADSNKRSKKSGKTSLGELVTVAFAEDLELAKRHKKMLEENGITSVIRQSDTNSGQIAGIPVLVPEDDLDEAHALIASQASFEEFFDVFFSGDESLLEDEFDEET